MLSKGLIDLHSTIRYFILILLACSLVTAYYGLLKEQVYGNRTRKLHLATCALINLQMIIGLVLYFLNGFYHAWTNFTLSSDMVSFFGIGHLIGMIIGIALINIGYQRSVKDRTDRAKYKRIALFYSIGTVIIFVMIPWPFFHSWATWF